MFRADAFSVLAKSVTTVRDGAEDSRAWDDVAVRLAAGVLQRAPAGDPRDARSHDQHRCVHSHTLPAIARRRPREALRD